jgi:hypothetical protein
MILAGRLQNGSPLASIGEIVQAHFDLVSAGGQIVP